jgi:hypothetical protein
MELEDFRILLEAAGYPVAYRSFPEGEAPQMPYVCYYEDGSNNFYADGIVYSQITRMVVELYTKRKDTVAQNRIENALSGMAWQKSEDYIDSEKCHMVLYNMEV